MAPSGHHLGHTKLAPHGEAEWGDTANPPSPTGLPQGIPTTEDPRPHWPASPGQLREGQRRGRWGRRGRPSARCPLSAACSPVRPGRLGGASRRLPPPILVLIGCQAEISEKRTRPARVKLPPKPGAERGISLGREEAGEAAGGPAGAPLKVTPSPPARPRPAQWAAPSYLTFFPGPESDTPSTGPGGHLPVPRAGLGPPGMPMVGPLLACLLWACDAVLGPGVRGSAPSHTTSGVLGRPACWLGQAEDTGHCAEQWMLQVSKLQWKEPCGPWPELPPGN